MISYNKVTADNVLKHIMSFSIQKNYIYNLFPIFKLQALIHKNTNFFSTKQDEKNMGNLWEVVSLQGANCRLDRKVIKWTNSYWHCAKQASTETYTWSRLSAWPQTHNMGHEGLLLGENTWGFAGWKKLWGTENENIKESTTTHKHAKSLGFRVILSWRE